MNPYSPPEATVRDQPPRPGSAFKAVAMGLLVDIGGSLIGTIIIAVLYGIALGAAGVKREDIAAALQPTTATDSWFFYASTLLGLGFSVLGGYVCARIARRSELKLGAILAALSAIAGLAFAGDGVQLGTLLSLTLLGIGAILVGAKLGLAKNRTGR